MLPLSQFNGPRPKYFFTDIDDTMTDDGHLSASAFESIWRLHNEGISVVPVTGRPAGWCEMIARQWPVAAVVGENGAFYFRYSDKKMKRFFSIKDEQRKEYRNILDSKILPQILKRVPGSSLASDQFCRLADLAIDFREDVKPLGKDQVEKIVNIFKEFGATAKISSIHVNGWFGSYDKLTCCLELLKNEFGQSNPDQLLNCCFVGDSLNDEPMFERFPVSFAVANIQEFLPQLRFTPKYVAQAKGGEGFSEIVSHILKSAPH